MPSMARGLDQRRRDHLGEAGVAGLVHRHVDQRELELGADAGEEVEARAGHLGAALEVDGAEQPAELDVVARLEVELARRADVLEDDEVVLAAGGRLVGRDVGDGAIASSHSSSAALRAASASFTLGGELLDLREQGLLLLALRPGDERTTRLLLGPLGLEVGDRLPAGAVGRQRPVDHVVGQATLGLGGADAVGVVTEQAGIDHLGVPAARGAKRGSSWGEVMASGYLRRHTSRVLRRPSQSPLIWAALCLLGSPSSPGR